MITNDRTEMAQVVRTASSRRLTMYASMGVRSPGTPLPPGDRACRKDEALLEVERDRHGAVRRARVLRVHLPRRDVADVVLHDAHPHERRRLTHGADAP